jgi:hypothetical protein
VCRRVNSRNRPAFDFLNFRVSCSLLFGELRQQFNKSFASRCRSPICNDNVIQLPRGKEMKCPRVVTLAMDGRNNRVPDQEIPDEDNGIQSGR